MGMVRVLLSLCSLFMAAFSWTDMSGTYIGKGQNAAVMVQIVETSGGNFTGRYEQVTLKPDGQLEDLNASIIGTRSGETVVATLKGSDILSANVPLSGSYRGSALRLTGGTNFVLDLVSGEEADFHAQVAALDALGRQIIIGRNQREAAQRQAKVEADRLAALQKLTGRLVDFTTRADAMLPKFEPEVQRYRAITDRMRSDLARQRGIYGGSQASVARSQISVALNQLAINAYQMHLGDQQSYRSFDLTEGQLAQEATTAETWCRGAIPASLNGACPKFLDAHSAFVQRASALRSAFASLDAAWTAERREQDAIVQASQQVR